MHTLDGSHYRKQLLRIAQWIPMLQQLLQPHALPSAIVYRCSTAYCMKLYFKRSQSHGVPWQSELVKKYSPLCAARKFNSASVRLCQFSQSEIARMQSLLTHPICFRPFWILSPLASLRLDSSRYTTNRTGVHIYIYIYIYIYICYDPCDTDICMIVHVERSGKYWLFFLNSFS
jgi:hypothetical protein